jgi:ABC-2 type transport system permease protein
MWRRLRALIVKELLAVWRDKKTRVIIIGPPLIQLVIFAYAATFDITNITVAVLNEDPTPVSRGLVARFEGAPAVARVLNLARVADIDAAIDSRAADVVVHLGPDFTRRLIAGEPVPLQVILDGRTSNTALVIQGYANAIVSRFNEDWAATHGMPGTPAKLVSRAWFNPNLHTRWMIVPSLVGVLTMIVTLLLTAVSVARERELGTMEQLLVTPLRPWEVTLGKTVPAMLVGLLDGSIIVAAAVFWFDVPLTGSVALLYASLFVFMLSVIGVGLFVSSLAQTQQQAILGAFMFVVPAIMLSGYATPIANMPEWLQTATLVNPLRYFLVIARGIFLKALPAEIVFEQVWPMLIIGLVTLAAAAWFFRRRLY